MKNNETTRYVVKHVHFIALAAMLLSAAMGCGKAQSPWVGVYAASWASTATFTSPPNTPPASYTDTGTITVTDQGNSQIQMSWQVNNNTPSGTIIFATSGNAATVASGTGIGGSCWMGRLANGAMQTTCCDTCTATLSADTLVQAQAGHFSGTLNGVPYSGNYTGTWMGTRTQK